MGSGTDGTSYGTDSDGNPNIFNVNRDENGPELNNNWANPDNQWNLDNEFMFRVGNYFLSVTIYRSRFFFVGF